MRTKVTIRCREVTEAVDVTIVVQPTDFILQNHNDKTMRTIERVVEYAEDSVVTFTITNAWRACFGHYQMVSKVLKSLRDNGLVVVTNPGSQPMKMISVDRYEAWKERNGVARVQVVRCEVAPTPDDTLPEV